MTLFLPNSPHTWSPWPSFCPFEIHIFLSDGTKFWSTGSSFCQKWYNDFRGSILITFCLKSQWLLGPEVNRMKLHSWLLADLVSGKLISAAWKVSLNGKTGLGDACPSWSKVVKWEIPTLPRQYSVWQNFWARDCKAMVSALPGVCKEDTSSSFMWQVNRQMVFVQVLPRLYEWPMNQWYGSKT